MNKNQRLTIESGLAGLTDEQLQVARIEAGRHKISLCESILRLGLVDETKLLSAAAERTGLTFLNISPADIEDEALRVARELLRQLPDRVSHTSLAPHRPAGAPPPGAGPPSPASPVPRAAGPAAAATAAGRTMWCVTGTCVPNCRKTRLAAAIPKPNTTPPGTFSAR